MKKLYIHKGLLIVSGLIVFLVGSGITFFPYEFYASNKISLENNASLLNEIRASGGMLLVSGLAIMSGAFVKKLTLTSTILSTLIYLSYGLTRVLSYFVDGRPADSLVQATVLEIIIGLVSLYVLIIFNESGGVESD